MRKILWSTCVIILSVFHVEFTPGVAGLIFSTWNPRNVGEIVPNVDVSYKWCRGSWEKKRIYMFLESHGGKPRVLNSREISAKKDNTTDIQIAFESEIRYPAT